MVHVLLDTGIIRQHISVIIVAHRVQTVVILQQIVHHV